MTQRLAIGRIIWAEIADANGYRKLRPAIVVTPTDRIVPSPSIDVVAISSRLEEPLPEDYVLLPWHAQGHPRTGLNRKCAAVCTWLARISQADIHDLAGVVPAPMMKSILARIAGTLQPPSDASPEVQQ